MEIDGEWVGGMSATDIHCTIKTIASGGQQWVTNLLEQRNTFYLVKSIKIEFKSFVVCFFTKIGNCRKVLLLISFNGTTMFENIEC